MYLAPFLNYRFFVSNQWNVANSSSMRLNRSKRFSIDRPIPKCDHFSSTKIYLLYFVCFVFFCFFTFFFYFGNLKLYKPLSDKYFAIYLHCLFCVFSFIKRCTFSTSVYVCVCGDECNYRFDYDRSARIFAHFPILLRCVWFASNLKVALKWIVDDAKWCMWWMMVPEKGVGGRGSVGLNLKMCLV